MIDGEGGLDGDFFESIATGVIEECLCVEDGLAVEDSGFKIFV